MAHTFNERLIADNNTKQNIIYNEHLIRYQLAKQYVKGKIVLDIACGSGYGAKILAQAGAEKVIAIDIDKETVNLAKKDYFHRNIEFIRGNAEEIVLDNSSIDIIVSFETIEHLKNPNKFLSEIARVIKKDGIAIISTPNKDVSQEKNPFHFKEYSRDEFNNEIKKYFQYCYILEQGNGISSYIITPDIKEAEEADNQASKIFLTSKGKPLYFIALCSHQDIFNKLPQNSIISINSAALNNILNNIGVRTANKIYSLLVKVPGIKKFLEYLKKNKK